MQQKLLDTNDTWANKCEELAQLNESLTAKAALLMQQNAHLRKANKVQPHVKFVEKAAFSAKLLALWHVSGHLTGKETCKGYGMKENTYFYGRAMLMLAYLHDGSKWLTDDPGTIEDKLSWAEKYAQTHPDVLASHVPNSRRPIAYRSALNAAPFGRW